MRRGARAAGATALYLHTAPFMTAAVALYEGLGYRRDPAVDLDVGARFGVAPPAGGGGGLPARPRAGVPRPPGRGGLRGRQGLAYAAGVSAESVGAQGLCLHR